MTAAAILALLVQFGPGAIDLIDKLIAVWSKESLTPEEVQDILKVAKKSYEDYIKEAP